MKPVERYNFGEIIVNGKKYTSDIKVFPDIVKSNWLRKEGHSICVDDIKDVLEFKPETIIIGTGAYGCVNVPQDLREVIKKENIELIILPTESAVRKLNEIYGKKRAVACLHLTC